MAASPTAAPVFDRRALPSGLAIERVAMDDGWLLRRMRWPAEADAAPRGHLLFLSGRADFGEKYLEAMAHWQAAGWAVTSFDWRGQGGSAGGGGPDAGFARLLADLAAMVAEWERDGTGPRVIVGHSMGGHLALRLIAERGVRLDAAVLLAPMLGLAIGLIPPRLGALIARTASAFGGAGRPVWRSGGHGPLRQSTLTGSAERYADEGWWTTRNPGWAAQPPRWGWVDAAFRSIATLAAARLEAVQVPILMLAAGRDRLVSLHAIRATAARLPAARLIVYEQAAHELLREADGVRLAALAAIDDFLATAAPA